MHAVLEMAETSEGAAVQEDSDDGLSEAHISHFR